MEPASIYHGLVIESGFHETTVTDVTVAFRSTATRWIDAAIDLESDLRSVLGDGAFADKLASRTETLDAVEAGGIQRLRIAATA